MMQTVVVRNETTIPLGRVGENKALRVIWPGMLSEWREMYGEGTVRLVVRRPKDLGSYPVLCEIRNDIVEWVVSSVDTANDGIGECELSYTVNDVIVKSQTWSTRICKSLSGSEGDTPPDEPGKAWFDNIQEQIGDLDDLTTVAKSNLVAAINEAAKTGGGSDPSTPTTPVDAVLYTEQTLTEEQQEQARANINASSNYARECSHLWFTLNNGEHYRDIVIAARSGGNPVVIREADGSGKHFTAPAIAVIGDYGVQNSSVPYPITIFSADGTMWFTEIYNLYGQYTQITPRMTELRRIDTTDTAVLHVTLSPTPDNNVAASDTTAAAVQEALAAGKVVTVTIGDGTAVWLLLSAVAGATTGSYDMQLVSALGVIGCTANGTQWTTTFWSYGGLATMDYVNAAAASLGGMHGAAVGQIVKIAEVDDNGTPLAWEAVDMPSGGGGQGQDGGYYMSNVDTNGVLTWTASKSDMPKAESANVKGIAGHTPVKGEDYWTAADKASIVADVLAALPTWEGGSY